MRRRKKLNGNGNTVIFLCAIIIICYIAITLFDTSYSGRFYIPDFEDDILINNENEENMDVLKSLDFTDEEIKIIGEFVSEKNITYMIENDIDKDLAMKIINEKYYIDAYLERYLTYYTVNPMQDYSKIVAMVNSHADEEFYQDTEATDESLGKFVILNKHYKASKEYKGENLITVDKKYNLYDTDFMLSKECFEAFLKMYEDAKTAGFEFKINSAYRSYERQVQVYDRWVKQDGQILADTYSARAGYSEHQTGFAFDVRDYPLTNDDFSKTKTFTWVSENAYKYGFILRFPKGEEDITGYQYESWHYRYVGMEAAKYIHDNNITFEEYYEYFIRFKNPKNLKVN